MNLLELLTEANVAQKIMKDPKTVKMLTIAWRHDGTLPKNLIAKLGPKPDEQAIVQAWSDLLDDTLRRNNYGDLSADGKFDEWLTRLYINGAADYEDINGEGGDALGAWKALSIRGKLKLADQDFNKFKSIKQLQRIRNDREYRDELSRIKDQEQIEKMKREAKDITIYDDERFNAIVPLNYGACYVRDKTAGYIPNFCTSSSSGHRWFNNYAPDGMIVNVVDKTNLEKEDGKWQFHAASNQLVRADQERRHDLNYNDERFATLFPGLMKKIISGIESKAEEIKDGSKELTGGRGYDIAKEVSQIKSKYPRSYASEVEKAKPEDEPAAVENGPGTYKVTQLASGRSARIPGNSLEDVQNKVLTKYPDSSLEDYSFELEQEQQENIL
jgi:hypothetical protein